MKMKVVEKVIESCLRIANTAGLNREELVVVLAQLLIRSGFSIHWGYEDPKEEKPTKINKEMADKLYFNDPSTGTTLMKIGFDLQEVLLLKK